MDKLIKIGFSVFAVAAITFGFIRLSNSLHLSFNNEGKEGAAAGQELLEETKQKITDTDTDGLSDWDELNIYGTSPYLADSDSDGESDSEESKAGTDPNCPKGKNCGTGDLPAEPASASAARPQAAEDFNNLAPDEIRALLKQGGITDEQMQGLSDEDLKNLVQETINEPVANE